jgi:hypothetical protein
MPASGSFGKLRRSQMPKKMGGNQLLLLKPSIRFLRNESDESRTALGMQNQKKEAEVLPSASLKRQPKPHPGT